MSGRLGHLKPPFPAERCSSADCRTTLTAETEAVLFKDLDTDKLVVFCGSCAVWVELNRADRWVLVAL